MYGCTVHQSVGARYRICLSYVIFKYNNNTSNIKTQIIHYKYVLYCISHNCEIFLIRTHLNNCLTDPYTSLLISCWNLSSKCWDWKAATGASTRVPVDVVGKEWKYIQLKIKLGNCQLSMGLAHSTLSWHSKKSGVGKTFWAVLCLGNSSWFPLHLDLGPDFVERVSSSAGHSMEF